MAMKILKTNIGNCLFWKNLANRMKMIKMACDNVEIKKIFQMVVMPIDR